MSMKTFLFTGVALAAAAAARPEAAPYHFGRATYDMRLARTTLRLFD